MFKKKKEPKMSNENHTDYSCLSRALWWAEKKGYHMPPLERAVFDGAGSERLQGSLRRWANGLLFDHDFARAVFGDEEVDQYGQSVIGIRVWARQVAVEMEDGKIMMAQPDRRIVSYIKQQDHETLFGREPVDPTAIVNNAEIVEIELKNIYAQIPLTTHRLQDIDIIGAQVSWKWHLQEMIISDNPFLYMDKYIDSQVY